MAFLQDIKECITAAFDAAVNRWRFLRDMRSGVCPDDSPYF